MSFADMRNPRSDDQQWYDRALGLDMLSPEKDEWNYCGHYLYQGERHGIHVFKDAWNDSLMWCNFTTGESRIMTIEDDIDAWLAWAC